jgi:SAM-dependent methyltransferase
MTTTRARSEWNRAYDAFPGYAADFAWKHVTEVLDTYRGERLYEVGFGSGLNLKWARLRGWEVAGCEVADAAFARGKAELPEADLRLDSIVECTAPSEQYDVVIDRAALSYLSSSDIRKGIGQIRRILKPNGVFFFNPYGRLHTWPFPEAMPPVTRYDEQSVRRLLPDTKWELLDFAHSGGRSEKNGELRTEHTLRVTVRKIS